MAAVAFDSIPVLSLQDWAGPGADRSAFADELRRVCHEIGFLQLVDHGVDPAFLDHYFAALRAFFELPEATKATIDKVNSPWFRGWERVGAELTDNRVDHREQLDLWTDLPPRDRSALPPYLRLDGPNQWLAEDVLPGFRSLIERFQREMGSIADELMAAFCMGFDLPERHLADVFGERRSSLLKLIHYPPTPSGEAGVNAHHDSGFLTLLWQHGEPGLQVLNPEGAWIDVPATPGAIVVNIGEVLQAMTGNYFVSTKHRVIASDERWSSGYFHGPDLRTVLEPLPLDERFAAAVAASPRHRETGFMARRDELLSGEHGTRSTGAACFGEQLWNYFSRSYPDLVARHHPDLAGDGAGR
ncbi:MAG: isopenicillin N synthase family oxygenase [Acidimicrobiales bacterium]|nr:isopenicillin N synthase family oxygenase [Acidimicrobiales bacterium]